ncbi:hypothetical protein GC722_13275 [Auraticoccus sp. F435]|uniref:Uncharacterized protein n=1 Tax=Auraticoccus cholistanensis TaxID=2656650 RepID=A0A6A9UZ21_9ACTN|nr:hypothetical protein [Auraticoccus cholistanensis]MVA76987.1 hypothetical protein [Auraticoccus cholistanensis]
MSTTTPSTRSTTVVPTGRTLCIGVLAAGSVLAAALAFGSIWLVRLAVVLAVLTGVVAVWIAWAALERTVRRLRAQHATELRQHVERHREQVQAERADTMAVLDTLEGRFTAQRRHAEVLEHRVATLRGQVTGLRRELAKLLPQVATLRGDKAALQHEVAARDTEVAELRAELARREAELTELTSGDVVTMPRRGVGPLPTAEQIWSDGNHPTVVDLSAVTAEEIFVPQRRQA